MAQKKNRANDTPDSRRVTAALAGSIDWKRLTIFVELVGDAEPGF